MVQVNRNRGNFPRGFHRTADKKSSYYDYLEIKLPGLRLVDFQRLRVGALEILPRIYKRTKQLKKGSNVT